MKIQAIKRSGYRVPDRIGEGRPALPFRPSHDDGGSAADGVTLKRALLAIWRRKTLVGAVLVLFAALGHLAVNSLIPLYTARATLVIDVRERHYVQLNAIVSGLSGDTASLRSQLDILRSRALARRVVEQNGLQADPEFNWRLQPVESGPFDAVTDRLAALWDDVDPMSYVYATGWFGERPAETVKPEGPVLSEAEQAAREQLEVVNAVLSRLNVFNDGNSYTIFVEFTSEDPDKASRIANAYTSSYLNVQLEEKRSIAGTASSWLNENIASLRAKVEQAEAAVQRFRETNGLLQVASGPLSTEQTAQLNAQLMEARAERARLQAEIRAVERMAANPGGAEAAPAVTESGLVQGLRAQEAGLAARLADLETLYGDGNPEVARLKAELASIRHRVSSEIDRVLESRRAEAAAANNRVAAIQADFRRVQQQKAVDDRALGKLQQLESEATAARSLFETFLAGAGQTSAQTQNLRADATVVSHADVPLYPSYPPRQILYGLAICAGLGVALTIVLILETMDRGFRGAEQLEQQFKTPVIGFTPSTRFGSLNSRGEPSNYAIENPLSIFAESIRSTLAAIRIGDGGVPAKVVLFSSAVPDEGKSTTALATAVLAADSGMKSVYIECDFRRPRVDKRYWDNRGIPLEDVLSGRIDVSEIVRAAYDGNLALVTVGRRTTKGSAILQSPQMAVLLDRLREEFDLVVLDTPPVTIVSDAIGLARMSDANILLVRWGKTPRSLVSSAVKKFRNAGAAVTGFLLTRVDTRRQSAYGFDDYPVAYAKSYYAR